LRYSFDWDSTKDQQNIRKHRVSFRQAATIFRDPNQLSIYDQEHSQDEERWITIGIDSTGVVRVVVHTYEQINDELYQIRIISARKATNREMRQYREENQ
jgi:hypothetical protein